MGKISLSVDLSLFDETDKLVGQATYQFETSIALKELKEAGSPAEDQQGINPAPEQPQQSKGARVLALRSAAEVKWLINNPPPDMTQDAWFQQIAGEYHCSKSNIRAIADGKIHKSVSAIEPSEMKGESAR